MTNPPASESVGPTEFEGRKSDILDIVARYKVADHRLGVGQELVRSGEPCGSLFHLTKGWLMFSRSLDAGRRQIAQFGLPGTVIGCSQGMTVYGVQALSDAVVSEIPPEQFEALEHAQPEIGSRLTALTSRSLRFAFDGLPQNARNPARERVAQLLLELFIRSRVQWPSHTAEHMRLPLADEHVVDATGLVGAPFILRELEEKAVLRLHRPEITILEPDKLVDAAGIDLAAMRSILRD